MTNINAKDNAKDEFYKLHECLECGGCFNCNDEDEDYPYLKCVEHNTESLPTRLAADTNGEVEYHG